LALPCRRRARTRSTGDLSLPASSPEAPFLRLQAVAGPPRTSFLAGKQPQVPRGPLFLAGKAESDQAGHGLLARKELL
jgi:hypothetical protein